MRMWIKASVAGAAAVVAIAGTTAIAASPVSMHRPANARPQVAADSAFDTSIESGYTPISPCRIVDTRIHGGPIVAGATRTYRVLGKEDFRDVGGESSCEIPYGATAITGSIISVDAGGPGYLKVYGYLDPEPVASFLNFSAATALSASGTIPLGGNDTPFGGGHGAPSGGDSFTVKAAGHATQLVIQLTGYYIAPIWVEINNSTTYVRGSRATGKVFHPATGASSVTFNRDVSTCAYSATSFDTGVTMQAKPETSPIYGASAKYAVYVTATDPSGAAVDSSFYLTVTC